MLGNDTNYGLAGGVWTADRAKAIRLMQAQPSLIKRPVVEHGGGLLVGFDAAEWGRALG